VSARATFASRVAHNGPRARTLARAARLRFDRDVFPLPSQVAAVITDPLFYLLAIPPSPRSVSARAALPAWA